VDVWRRDRSCGHVAVGFGFVADHVFVAVLTVDIRQTISSPEGCGTPLRGRLQSGKPHCFGLAALERRPDHIKAVKRKDRSEQPQQDTRGLHKANGSAAIYRY